MTRSRMPMLMLIAAAVLVVGTGVGAAATTWYVDDSGGADYDTIQYAVDVAGAGDTIYVYDGIYNDIQRTGGDLHIDNVIRAERKQCNDRWWWKR